MKYLITTAPRTPMPPERALAILQGGKDWVNTSLKNGAVDFFYGFPQGGGVGVFNAESHAALMRLLRTFPIIPFTQVQVQPLVESDDGFDLAIEAVKKALR